MCYMKRNAVLRPMKGAGIGMSCLTRKKKTNRVEPYVVRESTPEYTLVERFIQEQNSSRRNAVNVRSVEQVFQEPFPLMSLPDLAIHNILQHVLIKDAVLNRDPFKDINTVSEVCKELYEKAQFVKVDANRNTEFQKELIVENVKKGLENIFTEKLVRNLDLLSEVEMYLNFMIFAKITFEQDSQEKSTLIVYPFSLYLSGEQVSTISYEDDIDPLKFKNRTWKDEAISYITNKIKDVGFVLNENSRHPVKYKSIEMYNIVNVFDVFGRGLQWYEIENRLLNTNYESGCILRYYVASLENRIEYLEGILGTDELSVGADSAIKSAQKALVEFKEATDVASKTRSIADVVSSLLIAQGHMLISEDRHIVLGGKKKKTRRNTYESMTVKELIERCKKYKIKHNGLKKDELIVALRAKRGVA